MPPGLGLLRAAGPGSGRAGVRGTFRGRPGDGTLNRFAVDPAPASGSRPA